MTLSLSWHHSPYSYKDFINIYSNTQLRNLKFKNKKKNSCFQRERDERERDSVCVCNTCNKLQKKKLKDGFVNKYNILSTMMNSFINLKEKEIYTKHFTGK